MRNEEPEVVYQGEFQVDIAQEGNKVNMYIHLGEEEAIRFEVGLDMVEGIIVAACMAHGGDVVANRLRGGLANLGGKEKG